MIPDPTEAALDEQKREEARRQAESGVETLADGADLALGTVELLGSGAIDMAADAASAVFGASVEAAKVSLEVVGSVLSGLTDI